MESIRIIAGMFAMIIAVGVIVTALYDALYGGEE